MSAYRIIIQSRMSSTRLPAKALLPISGMPSVVLCAMRAANRGADVVVATSTDSTDDPLVEVLMNAGVKYVRGSLDDVLSRYELASRDLSERDVVVRLTADNLFPDGVLVQELVDERRRSGVEFLQVGAPVDELPYGVSAEAFTVRVLREANEKARSPADREHVTPWIMSHYGSASYRPTSYRERVSHVRCTIDAFSDYLNVMRVFDSIQDPIAVSWGELCDVLIRGHGGVSVMLPVRVREGVRHSALTLGTAQLGMQYGIANVRGQPGHDESLKMVRNAVARGINGIDCARGYGDAERRVGAALTGVHAETVNVITKLDPLVDADGNLSARDLRSLVDASVFRSCRELRLQQLQTLLLHRWKHRTVCGGVIWSRLLELRDEGVIGTLGASVQTPQEALEALDDPDVGHIQLPFNMLDWRWKAAGVDDALMKRKNLVVHSRSALLQGVLVAEPALWPVVPSECGAGYSSRMDSLVEACGRQNRIDLCIAYVRAQAWIDSVVVGMECLEQLDENIGYCLQAPLSTEECVRVEETLRDAPEALLDPSKWTDS